MKRCNNCGWFNLDSAPVCEKCEDSSFEIVEESGQVRDVVSTEPELKPVVEQIIEHIPESELVPKLSVEKKNPMAATVAFGANSEQISATLEKRKAMSATIMDASAFDPTAVLADIPTSCPKCCYPVSGDVDYCPNCGATIRKSVIAVKPKPEPVSTPVCESDSFSKATVIAAAPALEKATVSTVIKSVEDAPEVPQLGKTIPIGQNVNLIEQKPASILKATVADIDPSLLSDESDCSRLIPVDVMGEAEILLRPGEVVVIHGKKYRFEK